jgi:signal transduction histidine kinase
MLQRLIGEDINLRTVLGRQLGRVRADPTQIEQVLLNLAVNARDAMPRGGALTIEVTNGEVGRIDVPEAGKVRPTLKLVVRDTGVGISPEIQPHLFEPFFTTKGPGEGTGLGLATVYGIVKQSGGHVGITSVPGCRHDRDDLATAYRRCGRGRRRERS